jgi:hypothetical protein
MSDATSMIQRCGAGQRPPETPDDPEPRVRGLRVHQFTIAIDELGRGQVLLDGQAVQGVRSVALSGRVGHLTEVTLELLARVEASGTARVETETPAATEGARYVSGFPGLAAHPPLVIRGRRGTGRWWRGHWHVYRLGHALRDGWAYEQCRCGARRAVADVRIATRPDRAWLDGAAS